MAQRRALISGITGQDGSYLAELLVAKGYDVHGLVRRVAIEDPDHRLGRIRHLTDSLTLHPASLESYASVHAAVEEVQPEECYHLAAQSFVAYSFDDEFSTLNANINGTHYLLSAVRRLVPKCRFYFAGSSEMFGAAEETPQTEGTRFRPRSSYGISKVAGYELTRNYREAYGLHASSGILFNHESPRRGYEFVTRKITSGVARIATGKRDRLTLGNLAALRDWGHAREYVEAMWLMLQQEQPDDYVIATGQSHSVEQFAAAAFEAAGLDWHKHVTVDPKLFRPTEVNALIGDATKAHTRLAWRHRVAFPELVREMVAADLAIEIRSFIMTAVSAIVCNLNGKKWLPRLIESLRSQRGVEVEIIVADRESKDGSLEFLAGIPGVKVVSEPAATGLVAGYHAAVPAAAHDLLFFCNEDLWLDQDCLANLARHISLDRKVGAADPWQWTYDGVRNIHGGTAFVHAFLDPISCYPPRAIEFLAPVKSGDRVPMGSAGALLIHRRMYEEIGGWDNTFFMEFEDVDFFLRAWQYGWTCVSDPEARVYHATGQSTLQHGAPPSTVERLRRVGGESNRAVICLKHFTGLSLLWAMVLLCRPLVAHSLHLRFREASIYVDAWKLTWRRLPAVRRFRRKNRDLRRRYPGQRFFTEEMFQRK